jgi:hypothetical protein
MKTYTKESLITSLKEIRDMGWIPSARQGNVGGVGNTIEDLLGIVENNLPIPNAAEWELKAQRIGSSSLTTLFHMEPSPTACRFVPQVFLPKYGWRHKEAGGKYGEEEKSFRLTINAKVYSDRGFSVRVERIERKISVVFDSQRTDGRHEEWLDSVRTRVGLSGLEPTPYWGFDDLFHKVGSKLHNCFYLGAKMKKEGGVEYFHYTDIMMLKGLSQEKFVTAIEEGDVYVDFDARTGHNHGTKFRIKQNAIPKLYAEMTRL